MGYTGTSFFQQQELTSVRRMRESGLREHGVQGMKWGEHLSEALEIANHMGGAAAQSTAQRLKAIQSSGASDENVEKLTQLAERHDRLSDNHSEKGHDTQADNHSGLAESIDKTAKAMNESID
jgi:hypothetical protein